MIGDEGLGTHTALGNVAAQGFAARANILNFRAVFRRAIKRNFDAVLVIEWDGEAGAEDAQLVFIQFFLLVRDVFAFASFAETIPFNSAGEDDGRGAFVFRGCFVGGVNFARIVAAKAQAAQGVVGERLDQLQQTRIGTEEMLAHVGARFHDEFLIFAINQFAHALDQQAFGVAIEDGIPLAAPENFDDVPTRAAEGGFELLNNLAVAADGAIKALQIAIDDENQIVEFFAGGQGDGAERFGLIGFAIAEEGPDFGVGYWFQSAVFEIAIVTSLVNGHQRA